MNLRSLASAIRRLRRPNLLDSYSIAAPSVQEALNIFAGEWVCELPAPFDTLKAGDLKLFDDERIHRLEKEIGGFRDKVVLDLGPLEGAHPYMFEKGGAKEIISIEGNTRAYLKCLVTKELLGLHRVVYQCGDFMIYLRDVPRRFDIVNASGVLYHQRNPAELLALVCRAADVVHLWTHYYDESLIAAHPPMRRHFRGMLEQEYDGFKYQIHVQQYGTDVNVPWFCGGNAAISHWMPRQTILDALHAFGMRNIKIASENKEYAHGPFFDIIASRV